MNVAFVLTICIALLVACLIFLFLANRRSSSAGVREISRRGESTEENEAADEGSGIAHLRRAWNLFMAAAPQTPRKKSRPPRKGLYHTYFGGRRRA